MSLKSVEDFDYRGIVKLVDTVEGVHNHLRELSQLEAIHMVDVDRISMLLPRAMHMDWIREYRDLSDLAKIHPFPAFVAFLRKERSAVARLAESTLQLGKRSKADKAENHSAGSHGTRGNGTPKATCAFHGEKGHTTENCNIFKKLSLKERYDATRKRQLCFRCFQDHPRSSCMAPACKCGKQHHPLLCSATQSKSPEQPTTAETNQVNAATYLTSTAHHSLHGWRVKCI